MIGWIIFLILIFLVITLIAFIISQIKNRINQALQKFLLNKLSKEDYLLYKKWDWASLWDIINFDGKIK